MYSREKRGNMKKVYKKPEVCIFDLSTGKVNSTSKSYEEHAGRMIVERNIEKMKNFDSDYLKISEQEI